MQARRKPLDAHITWAAEYCKHCFTCINICPVKNLKFAGDDMISLEKCIQCQLCEKYCPDFALEVEPKKKSEAKGTQRPHKTKGTGANKGGGKTARPKSEAAE